MKNQNKGFILPLITIIIAFAVVGGSIYVITKQKNKNSQPIVNTDAQKKTNSQIKNENVYSILVNATVKSVHFLVIFKPKNREKSFDDIAENTGGINYYISPSEFNTISLVDLIDYLDVHTISKVTSTIETNSPRKIVVIRPSGKEVAPKDSGVKIVDWSAGKSIRISDPEPGSWSLIVTGSGEFSMTVTAVDKEEKEIYASLKKEEVTKKFYEIYRKEPGKAFDLIESLNKESQLVLARNLVTDTDGEIIYIGASLLIGNGYRSEAVPVMAKLFTSGKYYSDFNNGIGYGLLHNMGEEVANVINYDVTRHIFKNIQNYKGTERENAANFTFANGWNLGTQDNVPLARQLLQDQNARLAYAAAIILIQNNLIDEATPTLVDILMNGRNESQLNNRLEVELYHSSKEFGDYILLKMAKYMIEHFSEYSGASLQRATTLLNYQKLLKDGKPVSPVEVEKLILEKAKKVESFKITNP